MIRIAVVGPPGAGKSRLAEWLHMLTALPLIDLDDIYWGPAWSRPGDAEWARRHNEAIGQPEWIIAGNFQPQIADRLSRATHVVIVDPGVAVCLSRRCTGHCRYTRKMPRCSHDRYGRTAGGAPGGGWPG